MIGVDAKFGSLRIKRVAARPSMTGRLRSIRIRLGDSAAASFTASSPFNASTTRYPVISSRRRIIKRLSSVSSTTRTVSGSACSFILAPDTARMKEQAEPLTVLVVEDTEDNRFMMRRLLEMTGYRVVEALNGDEAVKLAAAESPNLILMDLSLPVID